MGTNPARRRALNWGYLNAALWSIGNGLTTGTLIIYLAQDLGAKGLGVSLVLAVPSLVGLLRLFSPALIRRFGTARRTCLVMYLTAYFVLAMLPAMLVFRESLPGLNLLAGMVGLICLHQLLEYIGTVALWSWLAELVPPRIRGRYFSRRQIYQLVVLIPTLWLSGAFADRWRAEHGKGDLLGYALPIAVGVAFLLASIGALARMPASLGGRWIVPPRGAPNWKSMLAPLADSRFRWWLGYGCWFSFFNGVTQSAQNIYPKQVLHVGLREQAEMRTLMQVGQAGVSLWAGPASDRYGNRPVLIASQLLVASGPLFFLLATPSQHGWLYGAWIVWAAYAGINICQPNLTLKLAGGNSPPYLATYFAATSVCYAASTVAGGCLFNLLGDLNRTCLGELTIYQAIFLFGWLSRTLGVVWLLAVDEPGAWTWRRILAAETRANPPAAAESR